MWMRGKQPYQRGMLYTSGAIRTMGRVDNQDAFLDTYALEREEGCTSFKTGSVPTWDYAGNTVRHAWTCGFFLRKWNVHCRS